jgi:hypothetical protein
LRWFAGPPDPLPWIKPRAGAVRRHVARPPWYRDVTDRVWSRQSHAALASFTSSLPEDIALVVAVPLEFLNGSLDFAIVKEGQDLDGRLIAVHRRGRLLPEEQAT